MVCVDSFFLFFNLFFTESQPLSPSLSPRDLSRSFPASLLQSYLGRNGEVPTPLSQRGCDILSHCLLWIGSAPGCEVTYASSILSFFSISHTSQSNSNSQTLSASVLGQRCAIPASGLRPEVQLQPGHMWVTLFPTD